MRAFVAIDLPDDVAAALERIQSRLPVGRLVPHGNLHLTLAFLDDQPEDALEMLHYELDGLRLPRFSVTLAGLGCFGGNRPHVVYAGVAETPELGALHRRVAGAARRAGIVLQRQKFHPHVTLARLRAGSALDARLQAFLSAEAGFALPAFTVTGFSLFQSELRPDGAIHHALARYALTQA